ncbi:PERC-like protein [Mya arenaria]|uniref:PERC-like protein n=1 Tax=Mya arenaria TaxID=6604 RepID=A0ABY7FNR6_MYAAR|nr:PERC-like protein [Mya arenaria]
MVKLIPFRTVILQLTLLSLSCRLGAGQGMSASRAQFQAAATQAAVGVEERIAAADRLDRSAFDEGVDRVNPGRMDSSGPQLLTTATANEIGRVGQAFLDTARNTMVRMSIRPADAGREIIAARIPPPDALLCPFQPPKCDPTAKFRTMDGSCNNVVNPLWGRSQTPFERLLAPIYNDGNTTERFTGVSEPRAASVFGGPLPNARLISREFHDSMSNPLGGSTHLLMEIGQFISHDIEFQALSQGYAGANLDCCTRTNRPGCFPIDIPPNDPFFPPNRTCINIVRALPTPPLDCTIGVRQQLNQITHYLDGSAIYGSSDDEIRDLRTLTGGLLKTSSNNLLPTAPTTGTGCILTTSTRPCFKAGDVRVNQQPMLMSMHTVWVREHNRLARGLALLNPTWDDERLFQEARRILGAELQHITYNEFLPAILGRRVMTKYGLKPLSNGYDASEQPMVRSAFATAAYRFGHSLIWQRVLAHNGAIKVSDRLLKDEFLKPDLVYTRGVGDICRGLTRSPVEKVDKSLTEQITNHLFERERGFGGDLAATNIQRGRDYAIPGYQAYRRLCELHGQFSHTRIVQRKLNDIYRSPEDIDLFPGGVSEIPVNGGKVGPTFACLIGRQFKSLKNGDRFYYENSGDTAFSGNQLQEIRKVTLASLFCANTDIGTIQPSALKSIRRGNTLVNCNNIPHLDLNPWRATGCVPVNGGYSAWERTRCFGTWRIRYRICNNPLPNECGKSCPRQFEIQIETCGIRRPGFRRGNAGPPDVAMVSAEVSRLSGGRISAIDGSLMTTAMRGFRHF